MGLSCGTKIVKFLLFVLNFCFFLVGAGLMAAGIAVKVNPDLAKYTEILNAGGEDPLFGAAVIFIAVLGAVIFLIGFLGCCGACMENSCMLFLYAFLVVFILILQVVGGILAAVFQGKVKDKLNNTMGTIVTTKFKPGTNDSLSNAWSFMQLKLKCCGAIKNTEWAASEWKKTATAPTPNYPISCCVMENDDINKPTFKDVAKCQADAADFIYKEGCSPKLIDWFNKNAIIIIGCAFGLVVFEIAVIIMACCLRKSINEGDTA